MFNTKKEVKRRLSIMLVLVMLLSLCNGFGFVRTENVWAAEDVVTSGEDASTASGPAINVPGAGEETPSVPTGPSVTVTPTTGPSVTVTPKPTDTPATVTPKPTDTPVTVTPKPTDTPTEIPPEKDWNSSLSVRNAEVTHINGKTLEELDVVFQNRIFAGAEVTIEATELWQREFVRWEVVSGDVELADPTSPVTTFTMPKENVEIKARYKSTNEYEVIWQRAEYADFIWAEDSEGNRIKEAKKGDLITIRVNPYGEYLQSNDWMLTGLYIKAFAEDLNSRGEVLVDMYNLEKVPRSFTLVMPEFGIDGLSFYFRRGGYWNNLNISSGKLTKVEGMTLQEANFLFNGKMLVGEEVTIEADDISNATFVKWSSSNPEVKFANAYAKTTTFIMPKSDVEIFAIYDENVVSTPTPAPSEPEQDDTEDATQTQPTTKPEEKNPDVVTEEDVYTAEEQEKLAEFKVSEQVAEQLARVEEKVQKSMEIFNQMAAAVKEKLIENITLDKAPATENGVATELKNDPLELMVKALSVMERMRVQNGEKLNMYMEMNDITETVGKREQKAVEQTMQDINAILNAGKKEECKTELGMYLNLNLMKQIGDEKAKKVAKPQGEIEVSIQVPTDLLNKNANVQRVYQVVCVQNGKSVLLDTAFNTKTNTLSFKASKFTTFALIYTDMPVEKKPSTNRKDILNNKK